MIHRQKLRLWRIKMPCLWLTSMLSLMAILRIYQPSQLLHLPTLCDYPIETIFQLSKMYKESHQHRQKHELVRDGFLEGGIGFKSIPIEPWSLARCHILYMKHLSYVLGCYKKQAKVISVPIKSEIRCITLIYRVIKDEIITDDQISRRRVLDLRQS